MTCKKGICSVFELSMFRQNYCRLGGFTEWKVLYSLCKDEKGFLHKDTVRAVYDGSLFEKLEHERKSKKESTKNK
jgi:peroxygenase